MTISELEVVNAFCGFCVLSGGTWPAPMAALGYEVVGVEAEITTILDGKYREVVPDIICASKRQQHILCVDAKSATVDAEQERAYATLTPRMLITQGVAALETADGVASSDVSLVTAEVHSPKLKQALENLNIDLPVIAISSEAFTMALGKLQREPLDGLFRVGVRIADYKWPTHFVPFCSRSTLGEMAAAVARALLRFILIGGSFSNEDIASDAIPHWKLCGNIERRAFNRKITSILWNASISELHKDFARIGKKQQWQVIRSTSTNPKSLDALQERVGRFVERLEAGKEYKGGQRMLPMPPDDEND